MKENMFRKSLVCVVIFLFLGMAFNPCINAKTTKTVSENESVDFIVLASGVDGVKPKLVKLTSQQVNELDNYMDSLKDRLENAATDDEKTNILNSAVIELNKFGLLPERMSVKKAQQLVVNQYKNQVPVSSADKENFNCQIVGRIEGTSFLHIISPQRQELWNAIFSFINKLAKLNLDLATTPYVLFLARLMFLWVRFLFLGSPQDAIMTVGSHYHDSQYDKDEYYPGEGWVWTDGTNGKISWEGTLYGRLGTHQLFSFGMNGFLNGYIGALNFSGIHIVSILSGKDYIFGSASRVKLGPNCALQND